MVRLYQNILGGPWVEEKVDTKVDDSAIQPIADGSDITPIVAYLVDSSGGIKRLSDEYIRFKEVGGLVSVEKEDMRMESI